MTTMNETNLTRAADPACRGHLANVTSTGSVALAGFEKGMQMNPIEEGGSLTANPNYPVSDPRIQTTAEAQDVPPVASGMDWFEVAGLALVAEGHISETRFRRAMNAARQAVDRA